MTGEEFGQKLLAELQNDPMESMKPLERTIRRVLGIAVGPEVQKAADITQMFVPPEFPQLRVKYDPQTGTILDSVVVNSLEEFGKLARERGIATWLRHMQQGD